MNHGQMKVCEIGPEDTVQAIFLATVVGVALYFSPVVEMVKAAHVASDVPLLLSEVSFHAQGDDIQ